MWHLVKSFPEIRSLEQEQTNHAAFCGDESGLACFLFNSKIWVYSTILNFIYHAWLIYGFILHRFSTAKKASKNAKDNDHPRRQRDQATFANARNLLPKFKTAFRLKGNLKSAWPTSGRMRKKKQRKNNKLCPRCNDLFWISQKAQWISVTEIA